MESMFNTFSLRKKLLSIILVFSLGIMFILTIGNFYYRWLEKCEELALLNNRILSLVPSLENTVWSLDELAISYFIDGMLTIKEVSSVVVVGEDGRVFKEKANGVVAEPTAIGSFLFQDYIHFTYPLYLPKNVKNKSTHQLIGQVKIHLNPSTIFDDYIATIINSTLPIFLFIILFYFILGRILYSFLTRPIEKLATEVLNIDLEHPTLPLLRIEDMHIADELGLLTTQFNNTLNQLFNIKDELFMLANNDPTTHLPNRNSLYSFLNKIDFDNLPENAKYTIVMIDLDDFKSVNDLMGHDIGDEVLEIMGRRLKSGVRDLGQTFRLGGDEFVIVYHVDISEQVINSNLKQLHASIRKAITIKHNVFKIAMSTGISHLSHLNKNNHTALKQCDIAMYESKNMGGNCYKQYQPSMENALKKHAEISELIHWALEHSKLQAYYQVKVCAKTKEVMGYELLVRLLDKQGHLVQPNHFIMVAEKNRQIIAIGRWGLEEGIKRFSNDFQAKGIQSLAINVSLVQLIHDANFVDYAGALLKQYGLLSNVIELEITENFLIKDSDMIIEKLAQLQSYGFSIALDDFGTGYSSLSCIQDLPINTLKIDMSFVSRLPEQNAIPLTIIALAKNLNLSIVAEGVETVEQSEWLAQANCTYLQGYLFGKPSAI